MTSSPLFRPPTPRLTVLYDGNCGFCAWTVSQLRSIDRHRRLEMVPLQHAAGHPERPELQALAGRRHLAGALHVLRADGGMSHGGGAMLEILDVLPGGWMLRPWVRLPGVATIVEAVYRQLAGHRALLGRVVARPMTDATGCDLHGQPGRSPSVRRRRYCQT